MAPWQRVIEIRSFPYFTEQKAPLLDEAHDN